MLYVRLFLEFFKAGLFAVGGGLATLPFLYAISDATGWFSHAQLADMVAVSESTPGPIGVNMATYVGFTTAGVPGMFAATIGLVTPSVIIILIVAQFLKRFAENKYVLNAFYGLRAASVGREDLPKCPGSRSPAPGGWDCSHDHRSAGRALNSFRSAVYRAQMGRGKRPLRFPLSASDHADDCPSGTF